jgi:hypothetical protein
MAPWPATSWPAARKATMNEVEKNILILQVLKLSN